MKRIPATLLWASSLLLLLSAASCTDTLVGQPDTDTRAITFQTPQADTRAAVTGSNDMSDFQVWGWYGGNGSAATTNVFNGTIVYKDAGWNYTDGVRYWKAGQIYNFYAVYPSSGTNSGYESALYDKDGNLTITNFDCTKGVDLMTASQNCVADEMIAEKKRVSMDFGHELARLKFTVKSENTVATLTSFKLYGVNYKGTLAKSGTVIRKVIWNPVYKCDEQNTPYINEDDFTFNTTNNFEKDMLGDVLLIPHTEKDLDYAQIHIAYRYQEETEPRISTINLKNTAITQWEAGKSYHYTLTIKGGTLTVTVKVVDWTEMDTSVSWG